MWGRWGRPACLSPASPGARLCRLTLPGHSDAGTTRPRPIRIAFSLSPSRPTPEAGLRLSRRPAVLCPGAASLPTSPSARGPRPRPPACGLHLPPAGRHVFPPASCRSDGNLRALGPRRPPSSTRRSSSATAAPPAAAGCRVRVSVPVSLGFFLCVLGPSCGTSAPLGGLRHSGCLCPQALRRWHCLSSDLTRAVGGARSARCTVTPPVSGCSVGSGRPGAGPRVSPTVAHDGTVPSTVVALARRAADPGARVSASAIRHPGPPAPSLGRIFIWGEAGLCVFKKTLKLDGFKVGSKEGIFDCEMPKDAWLVREKHAGAPCGTFFLCLWK